MGSASARDLPMAVVKVGGSLTAQPHTFDRVCDAVSDASRLHRLVVVPGGGPFADAVREFQRNLGLSDEAAHWMAILAMDQYAHVLAERIRGAVILEEPGMVLSTVAPGRPAVLAPSRWMRSADVLPHTWEVTSDSIAAFIAGALDASQLILIKPKEDPSTLDPCFMLSLPAGLPYQILGWERVSRLTKLLTEQNAAGGPG